MIAYRGAGRYFPRGLFMLSLLKMAQRDVVGATGGGEVYQAVERVLSGAVDKVLSRFKAGTSSLASRLGVKMVLILDILGVKKTVPGVKGIGVGASHLLPLLMMMTTTFIRIIV